jgi:nucleoside-diphosphate-sugar epimerase
MMRFLDRFAKFPIPYVGKGEAKINLVPVDYIVDSTSYLAHLPGALDQVYHLTDPAPYTAREAYEMICENLIDKKPSWTIPTPLVSSALSIQPFREWAMVEKETIAYFNCPAEYDTSNAVRDLSGSGISCPDFRDYIKTAVAYYKEQRHDPSKMIMVK